MALAVCSRRVCVTGAVCVGVHAHNCMCVRCIDHWNAACVGECVCGV